MSPELVAVVAWPLVAAFAICAAIAIAYGLRHPLFAGARLDAAEQRLAAHSAQLDEHRARIGQLESSQQMSTSSALNHLRGLGR